VKDDTRTVRLPDGDRVWLSLGARWLPRDNMTVDFGYTHLFVDDQPINVARPQLGLPAAFTSTVVGEYESAIDLVSLQFAMSFQ
jgi:long-chain fatty acid transport protein